MRFEIWSAKYSDGEYYVFKIVSKGKKWVLPDFDSKGYKTKLTRMIAPSNKVIEELAKNCDLLEV